MFNYLFFSLFVAHVKGHDCIPMAFKVYNNSIVLMEKLEVTQAKAVTNRYELT